MNPIECKQLDDTLLTLIGEAPVAFDKDRLLLKASRMNTPLGPMLAISDEFSLYLLEFINRRNLMAQVEKLRLRAKAVIVPGSADPIVSIRAELMSYFSGNLKEFKTPLRLLGSCFQKRAWTELMRIPYGQACSYADQAAALGKERAYRAVANANAANQFVIVIPCHRVINSNGNLGGYAAGIARKKWLIEHEKAN